MDNNFVNIDDLVRQRLGGGQEPERSGAWSRMEQLLDKEDRRKPVGLYWKRAMSYCGVAMLLAAVSVGGYEVTTAFRNPGSAVAGAAEGNAIAAGAVAKSSVPATNNIATNAADNSHNTVAEHTGHKAGTATGNHHVASSGIAATTEHGAVNNDMLAHMHSNDHFASSGTSSVPHSGQHHKTSGSAHIDGGKLAGNTSGATSTANNSPKKSDNQLVNANSTVAKSNSPAIATAMDNAVASVATDNSPIKAIPKNDHMIDHGHGTAYVSSLNKIPLSAATNKPATIVPVKPAAVTPVVANNTTTAPSVARAPMVVKPIPGKRVISRVVVQKTRVNGASEGRIETRLDTISINRITMELTKAKEPAVTASVATTGKGSADQANNNNNNNTVANKTAGSKTTGNKTTGNKSGNGQSVNTYAAQNNSTAGVAANTTNNKQTGNAGSNAAGNSVDNQVNTAVLAASANGDIKAPSDITPNAALSTPTAPPPVENKPAVAKKKHGSNIAESLSNMFNEVKYKLGGAQFAPGLTAGINGTFFGPNSFKGFQFGFTGSFELDDKWSFMGELKYFHRMNNDYSMDVTYNKYRPISSGGYYKDSTLVSYGFSTLHSFELPITMRYTAAKFSFFLGGNFLYTLSVNTGGAEQLVDPTTLPVVATNTANTTPSIKESDFGARFGVGYTCGMAYRVSPNVMLDFRNVQTVWDNAKVGGSQSVSSQLYKSPSLQFSLFYRLGAGKRAED
ncbi:hypothetical protein CJD36_001255 [Flavipsychrobacter stenotrophus]|uniref:Outer membrane protein beta-barrel domain-containing protein n=1 Tax=Flavipsychrobacter stenotrophus TaxID=2077091 RepID=A0A2S7T0M3_9BACT|nr:outer membrane beta-barrel protein [Flavipsychrobacter stenotrophus]PQJ12407.1 hypothetical protein CJD36_001255 [Flavipsychrobacter stenotrophus]